MSSSLMEYAPSPPYHPSLSGKPGRHTADADRGGYALSRTAEHEESRMHDSSKESPTTLLIAFRDMIKGLIRSAFWNRFPRIKRPYRSKKESQMARFSRSYHCICSMIKKTKPFFSIGQYKSKVFYMSRHFSRKRRYKVDKKTKDGYNGP